VFLNKLVGDIHAAIDFSELSKGIYFEKFFSEGQKKIVKIVKE